MEIVHVDNVYLLQFLNATDRHTNGQTNIHAYCCALSRAIHASSSNCSVLRQSVLKIFDIFLPRISATIDSKSSSA